MDMPNSKEFKAVCRKIQELLDHDQHDVESMDVHQVMKDVHQNFISISEVSTQLFHRLLEGNDEVNCCSRKTCPWHHHFCTQKVNRILNSFVRCILKWCVDADGGSINWPFFDALVYVEHIQLDAANYLVHWMNSDSYNPEEPDFTKPYKMDDFMNWIAGTYQVALSAESSPPDFMISEESVVQYLDQVLQDSKIFSRSKEMETLKEKLVFLRYLLHFTKDCCSFTPEIMQDLLICVEAVADEAGFCIFKAFYLGNYHLPFEFHNRIFLALGCQLMCTASPPLTDELLMGYLDCIQQKFIFWVLRDEEGIELTLKEQFQIVHEEMGKLVGFLVLYYNPSKHLGAQQQENLHDQIRKQIDFAARTMVHVIHESSNETSPDQLSDLLQSAKLARENLVEIIFLIIFRQKIKGPPEDCVKVFPKMLPYVFNPPYNYKDINLDQVMNNVYHHFTLISTVTTSRIEYIEVNAGEPGREWDQETRKKLNMVKIVHGSLIMFCRWALKWCSLDGGMINTNLANFLTDVESHLVDAINHLLLTDFHWFYKPLQIHFFEDMLIIKDMMPKIIATAYLEVLRKGSSPSSFITGEEPVLDFLDRVLKILKPTVDDLILMRKRLSFLRSLLLFTKDLVTGEDFQLLVMCVELVVDRTFCYSFLKKYNPADSFNMFVESIKSEMLDGVLNALGILQLDDSFPLLTDELLMDYVDCVQQILIHLQRNGSPTGPVTDQLGVIHEELGFLVRSVIKYTSEVEKLLDIRIHVQAVIGNTVSILYSSLTNKKMVSIATDMSLRLSRLLESIMHIKAKTTEIILLIVVDRSRRTSPQTDKLAVFDSLLENLEVLITCQSDLVTDWKDQFRSIHEDLLQFKFFLENYTSEDGSRDLSNRIINAAYEAEYLFKSMAIGACSIQARSIWISDFTDQMEQIKEGVVKFTEKSANGNEIIRPEVLSSQALVSSNYPVHVSPRSLRPTPDLMVGFKAEMNLLREQLVSYRKKLDIISIVGMPGLGKTTLAKEIYEDSLVAGYFEVRAWCCVSQEPHTTELLLTLLGSVIELTTLIRKKNDQELSLMLYQKLWKRRYLIVMDDLWGKDVFEDLKFSFPDDNNGSRILLTSRNKSIGLQATDHSNPLELRFLTNEEGWDLFKQKVGHEEEFPSELCQVGKEIVKKCRGLPLAVIVVAGLLAKSDKKQDIWEQVAENFSSYIAAGDSQTYWKAALELSYKFLPGYLKPFFLYLGAYPEDKEILVDKLIWQWIAEGFVHKTTNSSLEVQAQRNLLDLIDRSLLVVAQRSSDGVVRACRVHDLLRDLCLAKAKQENFLLQRNVCIEEPDSVDHERRLSVSISNSIRYTVVTHEDLAMHSIAPPLHSFLFFNRNKSDLSWNEDVKSAIRNLKLLKVLHFESSFVDNQLFDDLTKLVYLRYISIRMASIFIPSSISSLQNLETLIIKGLRGEILVPEEIWEMVKLRHLHINDRANLGTAPDKFSKLENLGTLSTLALYHGKQELIPRFPNLRKLRCIFFEAENVGRKGYQFPVLDSVQELESLTVLYHGTARRSGQFNLPSTIRKLALSKFHLKGNEILSFQNLPNLKVLKLCSISVEGESWVMKDEEFPELKVLKLESLNIKQWSTHSDNFPLLEKLVLLRCKKLEEIPCSFGEHNCLEKIEVIRCSRSAANSAKEIQAKQKSAGNESFIIYTYPPILDSEPSS